MNGAESNRPSVIVLLGGPGAGKGTQAGLLSEALGIPHISSGELLRERYSRGTQTVMQRGDLLPNDVVTEMVLARLQQPDARAGAILDGFPRTLAQAQALDRWLEQQGGTIRAAVYLDVPRDELIKRLITRGQQSGRADDTADAAARRIDIFLSELPALLQDYAERGLLHQIDGTLPVEEVHQQIMRSPPVQLSAG